MSIKLSPAMENAIEVAKNNNGVLLRYPGGFWEGPILDKSKGWVRAATVQALVDRALAEYTEHKGNNAGVFPVKMKLKG